MGLLPTILFVLALVLFSVGAYLTPDLSTKLTRAGLAAATLALLLLGHIPHV